MGNARPPRTVPSKFVSVQFRQQCFGGDLAAVAPVQRKRAFMAFAAVGGAGIGDHRDEVAEVAGVADGGGASCGGRWARRSGGDRSAERAGHGVGFHLCRAGRDHGAAQPGQHGGMKKQIERYSDLRIGVVK